MKRWICLWMCVAMLTVLCSCSAQKQDTAPDDIPPTSAATEPVETTALMASATNAPRDPDAVYEYETREIWCENNGNRIYGVAYIPLSDTESKFPLVIHAHGLGANHNSGVGYGKRYAEKGFAAYTFDFPGGSRPSRENLSDGDPLEMSPVTEAADLQAVLDTALTWDFVDTNHVFLEGGSQGGLVATMVGLDNTDKIHGMILHYPALYMPQIVTAAYDSPEDVPDTISFSADYELGGKFARDLFDVDVISRLEDFPHPVIIIQGSEDQLVSAASSEEAAGLFPHATFYLIEGAGHGFDDDDYELSVQYGLDFLFENT